MSLFKKKNNKEEKASKSKKSKSVFDEFDTDTPDLESQVFGGEEVQEAAPEEVVADEGEGEFQLPSDGSIQVAYDADGNGYYISYDYDNEQFYDPYSGEPLDASVLYDAEGNPFDFNVGLEAAAAAAQGEEVPAEEQPQEEYQEEAYEEQPQEEVPAEEAAYDEAAVEQQPQEEYQEEVAADQPEYQEEAAYEEAPAEEQVYEEQPQEEYQEEVAADQPEYQEEVAYEEQPQEEVYEEAPAEDQVYEEQPQEEYQEEVAADQPEYQEEVAYEEAPANEEVYEEAPAEEQVYEEQPEAEYQEEVAYEEQPQEEVYEEAPAEVAAEEQVFESANEIPAQEAATPELVEEAGADQFNHEAEQQPQVVAPEVKEVAAESSMFEHKQVPNQVIDPIVVEPEPNVVINVINQEVPASPIVQPTFEEEPAPVINMITQEVPASPIVTNVVEERAFEEPNAVINMITQEVAASPIVTNMIEPQTFEEPAPVINVINQEVPASPVVNIIEPQVHEEPAAVINVINQEVPATPIEIVRVNETAQIPQVPVVEQLDSFIPSKHIVEQQVSVNMPRQEEIIRVEVPAVQPKAVVPALPVYENSYYDEDIKFLSDANLQNELNRSDMANKQLLNISTDEFERTLSENEMQLSNMPRGDEMISVGSASDINTDELLSEVMEMNLSTINKATQEDMNLDTVDSTCDALSCHVQESPVKELSADQLMDQLSSEIASGKPASRLLVNDIFDSEGYDKAIESSLAKIFDFLGKSRNHSISLYKRLSVELRKEIEVVKEKIRKLQIEYKENERSIARQKAELLHSISNNNSFRNNIDRNLSGKDFDSLKHTQEYNRQIINTIKESDSRLKVLRNNLSALRDLYEKRMMRISTDTSRIQRLVSSLASNKRSYQLLESSFNGLRRDQENYQFSANNFDPMSIDGLMDGSETGLVPFGNDYYNPSYRTKYFGDFNNNYRFPSYPSTPRFSEYALNDDVLRPVSATSMDWLDDEFESLQPDRTTSLDSMFGNDSYDTESLSLTNELDSYFQY